MKTIYIDGGSTAYGMFDHEHGGWAHRLHLDTLRTSAADITRPTVVINRAMPGRTLGAAIRSLGGEMRGFRRLGTVVSIAQVGLNEAKIIPGSTQPIVPMDRFGEQLLTFCATSHEHGATPILVGPQPVDETRCNPSPNGCALEDDLIEEYGETMRLLAADEGVKYINTRELFAAHELNDVLAEDGYHPNELGHTVLHGAIRNSLMEIDFL